MITSLKRVFADNGISGSNRLIIAGGGLSAIFTAYEICLQARKAGRDLNVVVLANVLNAPCSAGSHVVLEHEGLFGATLSARERKEISRLFRAGQAGLEHTVTREAIECSLSRGYEWKAQSRDALVGTMNDTISKKMYRSDEFDFDRTRQHFNLPGYEYSVHMDCIGQINMGVLVHDLTKRIRRMGGEVWECAQYVGQSRLPDGRYAVESNFGTFTSFYKPLIATGAVHMNTLRGFAAETDVVYTMCLVAGPLDDDDRKRMASVPTAFSDTNLDGEVLWGGIDDKGYFTVGRRHIPDASAEHRTDAQADLVQFIDGLYPGLTEKYPARGSFGAMLVAKNHLPVVGRMENFDVMGGWAGEGIVPGYAAAQAYASWVLYGEDHDLKIFESLQPAGTFTTTPQRRVVAVNPVIQQSLLG